MSGDCESAPAPDPVKQRDRFSERLRAADVSTRRFIDVHNGDKRSTNHTQREPDHDVLRGNYGVYGGRGADDRGHWLVDVDVDDYPDDDAADVATNGLNELPETFTVESPHTDGDVGGHRYYAVLGDVADAFEARFGVKNPAPAWGEVRVSNQYCVGPGSQLEDCNKEWCDECETADGGYYRIADDRPIVTVDLETFTDAIALDYQTESTETDGEATRRTTASASTDDYEPDPNANVKAVLNANSWIGKYLGGATPGADRSRRDYAVCRELASAGITESDARELLDGSPHTKVSERGDAYWSTTWARAVNDADATRRVKARNIILTDGGVDVESEPKTALEASPERESETDADAEIDADDDGLGWPDVRELFRSSEKGTSGEAAQTAAACLLDEYRVITLEESDAIWRYDRETGIYKPDGEPRLRKALADGLNFTYSRSRVVDILHRVRSETYVTRDELGGPEDYVCVRDGVLDFTDPEHPTLLDHSPEYRFTWRLSAPYDPDAEADGFHAFLEDVVRTDDAVKLQEYAGESLRHWQQPRTLCAIVGPTDAGKGVFLRILTAVFGEENVASESLYSLSATRWGAAQLQHKPLNIGNELSTGALKHPELLKNLSGGGDAITAENKGEDPFKFVPTANHLFATNQVPQVQGADDAFYNRWLFVTFPMTVELEHQDDGLTARITGDDEELAGVLNWLIEGYARYHARDGNRFAGERSIAEKEDMWSAYGDSLERFVATCITTDDATTDDAIAKKDAYAAYKVMCDDVGVSVEDQRKLTSEVQKRDGVGGSKRKIDAHFDGSGRIAVYTNVRLTDVGERYLRDAIRAHEVADADDGDAGGDGQTGLSDADGWGSKPDDADAMDDEPDRDELPQRQAIRALLEKIDELTDDGRGDPVLIEDVVDSVVHTDERARHLIRRLIDDGTLIEDPDDHICPA